MLHPQPAYRPFAARAKSGALLEVSPEHYWTSATRDKDVVYQSVAF
jgi:hypothetical protein